MDVGALVIVIVIAIIIALIVLWRILARRRRAKAAQDWALQRGWQYWPEDPALTHELIGPAFSSGYSRRALNVVHGQRGPVVGFSADYQYKTDSTNSDGQVSTRIEHICVTGLQLAPPRLPMMVIPRSAFSKLANKMGWSGATTGDPQFDGAFRIEMTDEYGARTMLTAPVREYCLAAPKVPFGITQNWLITWKNGKRKLANVESQLQYLDGLIVRLPAPQQYQAGYHFQQQVPQVPPTQAWPGHVDTTQGWQAQGGHAQGWQAQGGHPQTGHTQAGPAQGWPTQ